MKLLKYEDIKWLCFRGQIIVDVSAVEQMVALERKLAGMNTFKKLGFISNRLEQAHKVISIGQLCSVSSFQSLSFEQLCGCCWGELCHCSSEWGGCCSCQWGEMISLNCCHQQAYCSSPRWYYYRSHGGLVLTGETGEVWEKLVPVTLCPT
jgi:hypothetical protein